MGSVDQLRAAANKLVTIAAKELEVLDAVRVVAAGEALLAPAVTRRLIGEFARMQPRPLRDSISLDSLTPREKEVLRLVSEGLSNTEIAGHLVVS